MNKRMSRALVLLCSLALALTMLVPAFAAETDADKAPEVPAAPNSITLDKTTLDLTVGGSGTLKATVSPSGTAVEWSSSKTTVATVSGGTVTAVAAGTATITAKAGDKTATCTVTVKAKEIAVTGISLDETKLALAEGSSAALKATVTPSNATDKKVTWSTSDSTVATVSDGKVTAKAEGKATITAKAGSKSATCAVTVTKSGTVPVTDVSVDKALTLKKDAKITLVATVYPFGATDRSVTWSSDNTKVATVSDEGEVTAKAKGKANITVTTKDGKKTATCVVTVIEPDSSTGSDTGTKPPVPNPVKPATPFYKPSTAATTENLAKESWTVTTNAAGKLAFKHTEPNGAPSTGVRYIETADGVAARYVFNSDGTVISGQSTVAANSGVTVTNEGEVLVNGNLYYLNPNRNESDPRTCFVLMDYLRIRDGYAGQTYYDQNGITFRGWIKNANGGLRYQTRIPQPGKTTDLYLIVWRVQDLPACDHPDHPGDPAYTLPAGRYFFDDEGVLVQREGWNDGKDGKEYYTNASGRVIQERTKQ